MCDRGRTITHMQIPRFHTQVWYKIVEHIEKEEKKNWENLQKQW